MSETAHCGIAAPRAISELESSCCTHLPLSCFVSRDFLWKQSLCSFQGLLVSLLSLGSEQEQQIFRKQRSFLHVNAPEEWQRPRRQSKAVFTEKCRSWLGHHLLCSTGGADTVLFPSCSPAGRAGDMCGARGCGTCSSTNLNAIFLCSELCMMGIGVGAAPPQGYV